MRLKAHTHPVKLIFRDSLWPWDVFLTVCELEKLLMFLFDSYLTPYKCLPGKNCGKTIKSQPTAARLAGQQPQPNPASHWRTVGQSHRTGNSVCPQYSSVETHSHNQSIELWGVKKKKKALFWMLLSERQDKRQAYYSKKKNLHSLELSLTMRHRCCCGEDPGGDNNNIPSQSLSCLLTERYASFWLARCDIITLQRAAGKLGRQTTSHCSLLRERWL